MIANDWGDRLDVRYYLVKQLSKIEGKKVLDIGCGKGYLLHEVPKSNEKYGIDLSDDSIKQARRLNPDATIKKASMFKLPFPAGFFDVVYMANVMPHADFQSSGSREADQKKAMAEASRVLKRNGLLLLTTPNNGFFRNIRLSKEELAALLTPHFEGKIGGWNPAPPWPYFLPARILRAIPGWFGLLEFMCEQGLLVKRAKFFFVRAVKRN